MEGSSVPGDERALLVDALAVPPESVRLLSREPLGTGTVAGFEVVPAGESPSIAYVDTSDIKVPAETGLVLPGVARVWTHPADPHLPALAPVAFGDALTVLLGRLGVDGGNAQLVAYRPGKRAVLRVAAAARPVWVKVVRPRRVERIVAAHRALIDAGLPVPEVRGWSPEGLIVVSDADGAPAIDAETDPHALLDEVDALRARIADVAVTWPARTGIRDRLTWYAERARGVMPQHTDRVASLRAACRGHLRAQPDEATIHGDLHLGQLFVTDGRITGLIDVDTVGVGDPAEDTAAFTSHLLASATLTPDGVAADRLWLLATAARDRSPGERAGALTAIHLLGHAVGAAMGADDDRSERLLALAEHAIER